MSNPNVTHRKTVNKVDRAENLVQPKLSDVQELAELLEDPVTFARAHGFTLAVSDVHLKELCEVRFAVGYAKGIVRKWLPEVKS